MIIEDIIMTIFQNMFSSIEKFSASIIAGTISLFAPVYVPIAALMSLMGLDAVYGYKVSRKYGHKKIESHKLWKTIWKMRDGIAAICGAHVIDKLIIPSIDLHAVEFTAGAIAMVEFWSLLESMCELHPEWKIWSILKKVLKAKGEKYFDVNLDKEFSDDSNNTKVS